MAKKTPYRAALIQGKVADVEVGSACSGCPCRGGFILADGAGMRCESEAEGRGLRVETKLRARAEEFSLWLKHVSQSMFLKTIQQPRMVRPVWQTRPRPPTKKTSV